MRFLVILLLSSTTLFAQEGYRVSKSSGSGTYQQAYLNTSAEEMQKLVVDNATANPSSQAKNFFKKFPILDSMKEFKKSKKYSLINVSLLAGAPVMTDDNKLVFTFKDGTEYKVPLIDRVSKVYYLIP